MNQIDLTYETGKTAVDAILKNFISQCEATFPDSILAYYLLGSQLDDSQTPNSDIDLLVVTANGRKAEITPRFRQLDDAANAQNRIELGCMLVEHHFLAGGIPLYMKEAALIYGTALFDEIPLLPIEEIGRRWIRGSFYLVHLLHGAEEPLRYPLTFPDKTADFFGYQFKGKAGEPMTKRMVSATARMAGAILALEAKQHAASKRQAIELYAQAIGGEWAGFVTAVYQQLNQQWHYALPHQPEAHAELRQLCQQFLAFSNHFVALARPLILATQQDDDPSLQQWAQRCLSYIAL